MSPESKWGTLALMMTRLQTLNLLYCLTGLLAFLDLFFLFRRRFHREVPWFAIYLATIVVNEALCDYLCFYRRPYWWGAGWVFNGVAVLLGSMFTIEAIRNALVNYPTVLGWGKRLLVAVALALLLLTILLLPFGSENTNVYMKITNVAMRSARMIQLGVILVFFAFTSYLALSWRHYQFGILLGYGLYVCVSLSIAAYTAKESSPVSWNTMLIESASYLLTLLTWLIYILRAEPRPPTNLPPSAGEHLEEFKAALTDLVEGESHRLPMNFELQLPLGINEGRATLAVSHERAGSRMLEQPMVKVCQPLTDLIKR